MKFNKRILSSRINQIDPFWLVLFYYFPVLLFPLHMLFEKPKHFFIMRYIHVSVWYCDSFYGCSLKKIIFIKSIFGWGWFDIYICLIKTVVEIEVKQKVV